MQHSFKHQPSLFDEDPIEMELLVLRGGTPTETKCARELCKFLLGKRGGHKTYVHALFSEILPRHEDSDERADILTHHILGFAPDEVHDFAQKPHSTLGAIWEQLVTIVYEQAYPGQLNKDWGVHLDKLTGKMKPRPGDKVVGEFYISLTAFEMKYRSGSYENTRKQSITAAYIRSMGLTPLMLCLRASPNTEAFRKAGWIVLEAEEALERIWQDTGIDVEAVVCMAGKQARITQLRETGRQKMFCRLGQICAGHYEKSHDEIAATLHQVIASDEASLRDVLRRALAKGILRDAVEDVYESAQAQQADARPLAEYAGVIEAGRDQLRTDF